ncbi:MAG: DUF5688 family protein [Clostridiales bacterium]|nr:DUF5688 family protein [Clostridiales bacterium]
MRKENRNTYEKFVECFKNEVSRLTEGWNAAITLQSATGDEAEDYLLVEMAGENGKHVQRFHMWELYQDLENGKFTLEEIFGRTAEMLDCCKEAEKVSPLNKIQNYQEISSHLIVRLLNYDRNEERLREGVYERTGDIALVLYANIGTVKGRYISSMIPYRAFSEWKQPKEEVMAAALKNTYELFPLGVISLSHLEDIIQGNVYAFMEDEELPFDLEGGYGVFLTNTSQMNGAVSIFLPGVAKKLGERMNGDFYIAFTSVHEAVLHKVGTVEVERIQESLMGMNSEVDVEEDFLSEQVYRYSREKDKIELVEF